MILSGGAGSGKTATIKVLSREMGIELLEYKTTEGNSGASSRRHLKAGLS